MTNSRDINLVLKARDEATRGIESVTAALNAMFAGQEKVTGSAKNTAASLTQVVAAAALIDKGLSGITGAADRAEAGFDRINSAIDAQKSKLEGLRAQYQSAQQVIARLNGPDAVVGAGRDQTGRLAEIERVRVASAALQREIEREADALARLETQVRPAASALQQLASTEIAAKDARATATAQIEQQTAAMARQGEAARALNAIRSSQYQDSGKSAADSAGVFAAAGPTRIEREINLRDENARKIAAETAALAEQARLQQAMERNTGLGRPSATQLSGFDPRNTGLAAIAEREAAALDDVAEAARAAAAAEEQLDAAAAGLRTRLNPLAGIQAQFNAKLAEAQRLFQAGRISQAEFAAAQKKYAQDMKSAEADLKRNGREGVGIFGLRPYEATNLGYQINDLVTQIGSGTSITQAFAQQGGQILQLFPKISSGIMAAFGNPLTLGFAATMGTITIAVKEAADEAERLRMFEGVLASIGNGADYSPQALEANVQAARGMGIAVEEATAATTTFVREGIDPGRIDAFNRVAKDMALVMGIEVPEAAKQLAAAQNGGYDAITKLDDATGFLTTTQREHIRTLFEEGRAQEARAYAFGVFADQMDEGASKMRGPWSDAAKELGIAWSELTAWLSNLDFVQVTFDGLERLGRKIAELIRQIRSVEDESPAPKILSPEAAKLTAEYAAKLEEIGKKEAELDAAKSSKRLCQNGSVMVDDRASM